MLLLCTAGLLDYIFLLNHHDHRSFFNQILLMNVRFFPSRGNRTCVNIMVTGVGLEPVIFNCDNMLGRRQDDGAERTDLCMGAQKWKD